MKRDLGLIRKILLRFEETDKDRLSAKAILIEGHTEQEIMFHIELMKDGDLLEHKISRPEFPVGGVRFDHGLRPTMKGYDFLDSVRDAEVWRRTKEASAKIGGVSIEFAWEIAKGFGRQIIKEKLGFDIS